MGHYNCHEFHQLTYFSSCKPCNELVCIEFLFRKISLLNLLLIVLEERARCSFFATWGKNSVKRHRCYFILLSCFVVFADVIFVFAWTIYFLQQKTLLLEFAWIKCQRNRIPFCQCELISISFPGQKEQW